MRRLGPGGLLVIAACLTAGGCGQGGKPGGQAGPDKLRTFVSIAPQAYFVERVGGKHVEVDVLVGPGQSYHAFEPTPRQVARLSEARLYFALGLQFEETLLPKVRASHGDLQIVETQRGVPLRDMQEHAHEHEHQHDHAHACGVRDPHIWLSPRLVKLQARNICDALQQADSKHHSEYEQNYAAFCADLDAVDEKLQAALTPLKGRDFLVFHPSYGYFADEYGLNQVAVEADGKEPTARQLAEVIARAKAGNARVVFVQPQFARKSAERVAEAIGGVLVELDPLARDYIRNLEMMAVKIKSALAPGDQP